MHVSRCLKENLKFVFENNEENVWAYLFGFHRIPYKPKNHQKLKLKPEQ